MCTLNLHLWQKDDFITLIPWPEHVNKLGPGINGLAMPMVRKQAISVHYWHIYMWPDLSKGALYTHSFRSHFSPPFNKYNNRLTVHAYNIAKGSMVYFPWGLIHESVWCPQVLEWSVNGSNFPGQADNWQGISARLAGKPGIEVATFCDMGSWKQPELMPFSHINFFELEVPTTSWLPTIPPLHPYRTACGINYFVK